MLTATGLAKGRLAVEVVERAGAAGQDQAAIAQVHVVELEFTHALPSAGPAWTAARDRASRTAGAASTAARTSSPSRCGLTEISG
ncbi:hypothetical protein ACIQV3_10060 [Streptomyces sp. NPDC099050]|uniref:hypothetical protein n=1 Tax=Streptomyces sp. NPDC099050 TaxID=3366100 RepID=UPI0037F9908D